MNIYIAGPMRGYDNLNFAAFDEARDNLITKGHEVISPADLDRECFGEPGSEAWSEFNLNNALAQDLTVVCRSALVAVLDGWQNSLGAIAEVSAAIALDIPVLPWEKVPLAWSQSTEQEIMVNRIVATPSGRAEFVVPGLEPVLVDVSLDGGQTVHHQELRERDATGKILPGEVRSTSASGGQKGTKLARFDLLPPGPLTALAEHYGRGAKKYDDYNWHKGYEWSKSFAAMMRHAWAFWGGEDIDPETGSHHLTAVAWHAFAMQWWAVYRSEYDDRPTND